MSATSPVTVRRTSLTWMVIGATLSALLAVPIAAEAASAAPKCFGKVATIVGTTGNDTIKGTAKADVIVARGGNDVITGLKGNDRICAGPGADVIKAGGGADLVAGGAGNDKLIGYTGPDKLLGNTGSDLIRGGDGNDTINGGFGVDRCFQNAGTGTVANCETADFSVLVSAPANSTGPVTFTVTVTNNGPSAATYKLALSQSSAKATCDAVDWAIEHPGAMLAAGATSAPLEVEATCTPTAPGGAKVFVDATVSTVALDPDPLNDAFQGKSNLK